MKTLTGKCDHCLAPGSLYYPDGDRYLCAQHARLEALWDESREHLIDLLAPVVSAWAAHWRERGLGDDDLESRLMCFEDDLLEAAKVSEEQTAP